MMGGFGYADKGELEARLARQRNRSVPQRGGPTGDKKPAGNTRQESYWIAHAFGEIGRVFGDMFDSKVDYLDRFKQTMLTKNHEDIRAYAKVLDAGEFDVELAKGEDEPLPEHITVPAFTKISAREPHPVMYFRRDLFNTNP